MCVKGYPVCACIDLKVMCFYTVFRVFWVNCQANPDLIDVHSAADAIKKSAVDSMR